MTGEWNIILPPEKEGEPDCTKKQLDFIRELFENIGSEGMNFEKGDLGKWQASSLIEQLINIRDNGPNGKLDL